MFHAPLRSLTTTSAPPPPPPPPPPSSARSRRSVVRVSTNRWLRLLECEPMGRRARHLLDFRRRVSANRLLGLLERELAGMLWVGGKEGGLGGLGMVGRDGALGAHDPNSLLHGGFDYIERGGDGVQVPLLPGDRGRRHLTMADSVTEEFRPSRRVLPPSFSGAQHPRPQGLAKVEPCIQKSPRETGIRTNETAARRSGYDIPDPGLVLQSKHTVTDDTGRAARDRISGELTLEKAFGLKRMVKTQRERRGGMPAKGNPGDKNFHHVENSPGFHQAGELSVGSSFYRTMPRRGGGGLRGPAAATAAPDGVGYASGAGGYGNQRKMSFREARREASYVESLREVLELTASKNY
eukprot:jgi/Undpi1/9648/HiC_scaffold_27.g12104.m1